MLKVIFTEISKGCTVKLDTGDIVTTENLYTYHQLQNMVIENGEASYTINGGIAEYMSADGFEGALDSSTPSDTDHGVTEDSTTEDSAAEDSAKTTQNIVSTNTSQNSTEASLNNTSAKATQNNTSVKPTQNGR